MNHARILYVCSHNNNNNNNITYCSDEISLESNVKYVFSQGHAITLISRFGEILISEISINVIVDKRVFYVIRTSNNVNIVWVVLDKNTNLLENHMNTVLHQ